MIQKGIEKSGKTNLSKISHTLNFKHQHIIFNNRSIT